MAPSLRPGLLARQTRTGYSCGAWHILPVCQDLFDDEVTMAKHAPYSSEADYVVIGSGSSGAAVAGRLAQSGASVIVLEAGKTDEKFLVKKPGMIGPMHAEPKIKRTV